MTVGQPRGGKPSSAANQRFRFTPAGGDVYEADCTHTALAWDVGGGSRPDAVQASASGVYAVKIRRLS
ncbi:hypothetical protein [Kitasatospora sp. NPDC050463]|uniref:hypothetical protein n=1 Tax=Kitasatospora sp. NPDC050463 TaxID=3155786 RepID=UPI0033EB940A